MKSGFIFSSMISPLYCLLAYTFCHIAQFLYFLYMSYCILAQAYVHSILNTFLCICKVIVHAIYILESFVIIFNCFLIDSRQRKECSCSLVMNGCIEVEVQSHLFFFQFRLIFHVNTDPNKTQVISHKSNWKKTLSLNEQ